MSKERLSKLQKLILLECYHTRFVARSSLRNLQPGVLEPSISRSVWKLIESGLIEGLSPISLESIATIYGMQGKSLEEFKNDYKELLNSPKTTKVPIQSLKGLNKAKILTITDKGSFVAEEVLNVK